MSGSHEHHDPEHGPACNHDHEHGAGCHHDHDHDHAGHGDHAREATAGPAHAERPCTQPGIAVQYDLAAVIPGEKDEVGRFHKLELLLEAQRGITDVHFRRDGGRPEICIHYEPERITLSQVIALVKTQGLTVSDRYKEEAWFVRGMDSPQCAFVIEHALRRVPGILSASVAYAAERLVVEYDRQTISPRQIAKKVDAFGYRLETPGEKGARHLFGSVLLTAAALRRVPVAWPRWMTAVPAYGIGTMAAFWFLQRAVPLL